MSVQILNACDGLMTLRFEGKLSHTELVKAQDEAAAIFRQQGQMNVLVLADTFAGWEKEGDWGDISFQLENDQYMKKIAIVGGKEWELLTLIFVGKGVRRTPVEFFPTEELAKARVWLAHTP